MGPGLDDDVCYLAVRSRDRRFDGRFSTAVLTTGIYCRPSCPARTPLRRNVRFFVEPAGAERAGFRPCRRCRPDLAPDSPDVDVRGDLLGRALRLVADGVVDTEGVAGLAARLHVGERHLRRSFVSELGAGPLEVARHRRVRLARALLESSGLPASEIAFAAGFGSIRQFNDAIRASTGRTPTQLRAHPGRRESGLVLRLAARPPFDPVAIQRALGTHAVPGLEWLEGSTFHRIIPGGRVCITPTVDGATLRAELADPRALATVARRARRLLDLDADPVPVLAALGPLADRHPGLRVMGAWEPWEGLARVILGQHVSLAGAARFTGRLVAGVGDGTFPSAARVAEADLGGVGLTTARAGALRAAARAVADGRVRLDGSLPTAEALAPLGELPGIGPWTLAMVALRVLRDPDAWPATDLVLKKACTTAGITSKDIERWRPWRAYAATHLWEEAAWGTRSVTAS